MKEFHRSMCRIQIAMLLRTLIVFGIFRWWLQETCRWKRKVKHRVQVVTAWLGAGLDDFSGEYIEHPRVAWLHRSVQVVAQQ